MANVLSVEHVLRERRLSVWTEAKNLAEHASREGRAFTASEQAVWERLNDELDVLGRRLKSVLNACMGDRPAANSDFPWRAKINYQRKPPLRKLPAGCWSLLA